MAKPIKVTPTLTGKDAERFLGKMKKSESTKASKSEHERVKSNYSKISKFAKF